VTIRGKPPSTGTTHTCGIPLRFEIKLIHLPSGEKLGLVADPTRAMRATVVVRSDLLGCDGSWAKQKAFRTRRLAAATMRKLMDGSVCDPTFYHKQDYSHLT
jgi:hypothetical protein